MKPLLLLLTALLPLSAALGADAPVDATIVPGTNRIQTLWNATPGRTYRLQSTTNLSAPWLDAGSFLASSNALSQTFFTAPFAQFFRVLAVDREGPEVYRTEPAAGGIAVSRSATLRAWLRDASGIATNTLALTIANPTTTNAPVTLTDARLTFDGTMLTYTPTNTETLGAAGDTVTVTLAVADTVGNQTTNFTWSFQLELPAVASTNLVFLGGIGVGTSYGVPSHGVPPSGGVALLSLGASSSPQTSLPLPAVPAKAGTPNLAPQTTSTLSLIATNGDTFTYSYTGAGAGLTNGQILVNANLSTGYTRAVISFTNNAASSTVDVLTRPAKLAELLQDGSLVSQTFTEITTNAVTPSATLQTGLPINYHHDLAQVVYQDGSLTVELLPGSAFDWNGKLDLGLNVRSGRLREFETTLSGAVSANLQARVSVSSTVSSSGTKALLTPIHKTYGTFIGAVPVWVEVVYEVNAGYSASATATDSLTMCISGTKDILVGRRWSDAEG